MVSTHLKKYHSNCSPVGKRRFNKKNWNRQVILQSLHVASLLIGGLYFIKKEIQHASRAAWCNPRSKMLSGDQSEAKLISGGTTCCSSLKTDRISPSKYRRKDAKVAMCCAMQGNTQLMAMLCLAALLGCGELRLRKTTGIPRSRLHSQLQKGIHPDLLARVKMGCQKSLVFSRIWSWFQDMFFHMRYWHCFSCVLFTNHSH